MGTGRAQVEGTSGDDERGEGGQEGFKSQGCFSSWRKERDKTTALEVHMCFFSRQFTARGISFMELVL